MSAIVTDNFRIQNATNFVDSVTDVSNSYYVFLGLSNPQTVGFGRTDDWNDSPPSPIDNTSYLNHASDTMLFGKRVTSGNVRRLVRRVDWVQGERYEMYRHDYSAENLSAQSSSSRLYDSNYYIVNRDFKVYICIDNGSNGDNPKGNASQDEPTFTDLEPTKAGESGDGYIWKYLYTVSPADIVKFDTTDYISVPNEWDVSTDSQIKAIRENGDSDVNKNQIKKVYIEDGGEGYGSSIGEVDIIGDGTGAKVLIKTDSFGKIIDAVVTSGGSGYTYGMVDLRTTAINQPVKFAKLIPIIPPSKGHGYDIYTELGADKVLIYNRFDDSTKDFPIDTKFSQVGIIKNPKYSTSDVIFSESQFSALNAIKIKTENPGSLSIGEEITQLSTTIPNGYARGWVASYDLETKVVKYYQDRSLYLNTGIDNTDYVGVTTASKVLNFETGASANNIVGDAFSGSIDYGFSGIVTSTGTSVVNLSVEFTDGLATTEINKKTGTILYLDNRAAILRNSRQKEDIKIILEF